MPEKHLRAIARRTSVICFDCGRRVRPTHAACNGDPRATCIIFGCGDPAVVTRLEETHGDGRMAHLAYCEEHR